jgi:hypothetical protein
LWVAFGFVVPLYLLLAWLVLRFMGEDPLLGEERRFLVYACLCAVGRGAAVLSFQVRGIVAGRRTPGLLEPGVRALVFALALSEVPAFLGLLYVVLYRDGLGFVLLAVSTLVAFILHALRD